MRKIVLLWRLIRLPSSSGLRGMLPFARKMRKLQSIDAPDLGGFSVDPIDGVVFLRTFKIGALLRQQVAEQVSAQIASFRFPPAIVDVEFGLKSRLNATAYRPCWVTYHTN